MTFSRTIVTIVVLTLASIALHEFGHYLVYRSAGVPVKITIQSVRPVGAVKANLDAWAKLAGPLGSWIAAILFSIAGQARQSFAWTTASFTNGSLRLFPACMDLARSLQHRAPFSDEGDVAVAWTHSPSARVVFILAAIVISLSLSVLAARQYAFHRRRVLKCFGIYLVTLVVGIGIVILDETGIL